MLQLLRFFPLALLTLGMTLASAEEPGYPAPKLLIEPADLIKAKDGYVVLDARERKAYDAGHVPNARWIDPMEWAKSFGEGTDATAWGKRIGALGIGPDTKVVVYDASRGKDAARIWWQLRYWGVEDVRLLNGGWVGWQEGKHPIDKAQPTVKPVAYDARTQAARLATRTRLLESLKGNTLQIVDARSLKEYTGEEKQKNKRGGAIPTAKHLEWTDLLDAKTHRFKSPEELRKIFKEAGIALDQHTATYCQSGGRAAVMAFGLELMGVKDVCNYYRSWGEWGNAEDTPVVQPKR